MIFGDEKLTPLRSVPRCALPSVGSFNTGTCGSLRCTRSTQIPPLRYGTSHVPETLGEMPGRLELF